VEEVAGEGDVVAGVISLTTSSITIDMGESFENAVSEFVSDFDIRFSDFVGSESDLASRWNPFEYSYANVERKLNRPSQPTVIIPQT
jgi:hypothetical protein